MTDVYRCVGVCVGVVPAEEAQAVREVAAELIRMADEFNQIIVSQAADRLTTKLRNSSPKVSFV